MSTSTPHHPRRVLASALAIAMLAAIGVGAYLLWPASVPAEDASPGEIIQFVASDRFTQLPEDQRRRYIGALGQNLTGTLAAAAALPEPTQDLAFANALQTIWNRQLDEWLKLDAAGKQKYVAELMKRRPQRRGGSPTTRPGTLGGGGRGPYGRAITPERQKRFIENMPPYRRAAMAEFMGEVRKAREAGGGGTYHP